MPRHLRPRPRIGAWLLLALGVVASASPARPSTAGTSGMIVRIDPSRVRGGDVSVLLPPDRTVAAASGQGVTYRGEGFFRGYRVGFFTVDASAAVDLRLSLRAADTRPLARALERPEASEKTRAFLERWVANPEAVGETWRERPLITPTFRPTPDGSPVEYVIVTDDSLAAAYQALADWKTARGVQTQVCTMSWVLATYEPGVDRAQTLRRFLKDAYANWGTTDVLLGGDADVIPFRYGRNVYAGGDDIPTDLYYQCLDGEWNDDGDSLFGEGKWAGVGGDAADLLPEINVGRVTAHTAAEVSAWVAKVETFQDAPPLDMTTKALLLSEVLVPPSWTPTNGEGIALDGAAITDTLRTILPPAMTLTRLYQNTAPYPGSLPETRAATIDSLNAGYSIVEHMGHGFTTTLSVGDGELLNADVDALLNGARQGVIYAVNCNSASFELNAIGERFLLNPAGGAVCYIGASRYDFPTYLADYQDEFFTLLYRDSLYTVGDAHTLSKALFAGRATDDNPDRWTQFSVNMLGDPGVTMYRHRPRTLTLAHTGSMALGAESYDVQVLAAGAPVRGARVALAKGTEAYAVAVTDGTGHAIVPFVPATSGSFTVSASASSELPATGSALVVTGPGPVVEIGAATIVDDGSPPSVGNGDGQANTGEVVEVVVSAVNRGTAKAFGVTAVLRASDPGIAILDSTGTFGTVGFSGPPPRDAFVVQVRPAAMPGHQVECTIRFTDNAARAWNRPLRLSLYPPVVDLVARAVWDTLPGDDRDGVLDRGELIQIVPTFVNRGGGTAAGFVAHLRAADATTTILDSTMTIAAFLAGATGSGDEMRLRVAANGAHRLTLWATDAYGDTLLPPRLLDFALPPTPGNVVARGGPTDITLTWTAVTDPGLAGYAVYRAPGGSGVFTRVNPTSAEPTALYQDYGLQALTRYDYQVSAVDSSGNESPPSAVVATTTTPAMHAGFPVSLGAATSSSVIVANADASPDGSLEILAGGNRVYAMHADGTEPFDGDGDASTLGPLSGAGVSFSGGPSASDLDGDGTIEIAAASYDVAADSSTIYVFAGATGAIRAGWPRVVPKLVLGSPALGDIDGDGAKELVIGSSNGFVYAWHHTGVEVRNGDGNASTNGVFAVTGAFVYGTAAFADLDNDGVSEIVIGSGDGKAYAWNADGSSVPGWPYVAGGAITASPAIGDFENDGRPEVAIASQNNVFHIVGDDGVLRWQRYFNEFTFARTPSPAFADLDGDGFRDVIAVSTGGVTGARVYAFNRFAQALPGWSAGGADGILYSAATAYASECSPVIADVDGDGHPDVLLGAEDATLNGWRHDGAPLPGFPIRITGAVRGSPAVWDMDADGRVEIALAGYDQTLYVWDGPAAFSPETAPWPLFHHDDRSTGDLASTPIVEGLTTLTAVTPPPTAPPDVLTLSGARVARAGAVRFDLAVPVRATHAPVTLDVYDAGGRLLATPLDAVALAGQVSVTWDRRDRGGRRVASGIVFARLRAGREIALVRVALLP